jgi:hypothetical protein
VALSSLALALASAPLTAPSAVADGPGERVPLPHTGEKPTILAASGPSILIATGEEGGETYRLTTNSGKTLRSITAPPAFTPAKVRYTGAGHMIYVDEFQGDDQGDFTSVYDHELATGVTDGPYRVDAESLVAAGAHAVIFGSDGNYSAEFFGQAPAPLAVPDHGAADAQRFVLTDASAALRLSTNRDATKVLTTGYLDSVPLDGSAAASLPVAGLATAEARGGQVVYVVGTGKSARVCFASLANLAAAARCTTVASGNYSRAVARLSLGAAWVLLTLSPTDGGTSRQYVIGGTTKPATPRLVARTSSMQSLALLGRGDSDRPLGLMVTAAGGSVVAYDLAKKKVSTLFAYPRDPFASVGQLQLTPAAVLGLDDRPAPETAGRQAWRRPLADLGTDVLLTPRASQVLASAGRTLVAGSAGGLALLDGMKTVRTLPSTAELTAFSGRYYLTRDAGRTTVRRVDGAWLAAGRDIVALFGSVVVRQAGTTVTLEDLQTTTPVTVTVAAGVDVVGIWGPWLLAKDADGDTVVVDSRTGDAHSHEGTPLAIGDRFAVIAIEDPDTGLPVLHAWAFADDEIASLPGDWTTAATDGVKRVAWTTATELVVASLDDLLDAPTGGTPPRALGLQAPGLFNNKPSSARWTFELDATKALAASGARLQITNVSGTEVARLTADDTDGDGSVRIGWNGRDTTGKKVPAGAYTWRLDKVEAADGTGKVTALGGQELTGTITVVRSTPSAVVAGSLTVSDRTPELLQTIEVDPGTWKPAGAVSLAYQWYRGSKAIAGATGRSYDVVRADVGAKLRVKVTGASDGRRSTSRYSAYTAAVTLQNFTAVPFPTIAPGVDPVVGNTLQASCADAEPVQDARVLQWYRVSKKGTRTLIKGATHEAYTLVAADVGSRLQVRATFSRTDHVTTSTFSTLTDPVT